MPVEISEARFEQDIEASLPGGGPDDPSTSTDRVAEPAPPAYGAGACGSCAALPSSDILMP